MVCYLGELMRVASNAGRAFGATSPTVTIGGHVVVAYNHYPAVGRVTRLTVPVNVATPPNAGKEHWDNLESAMVSVLAEV